MFVLVFVSRDFELGRNVSCKESTVSPVRSWFIIIIIIIIIINITGWFNDEDLKAVSGLWICDLVCKDKFASLLVCKPALSNTLEMERGHSLWPMTRPTLTRWLDSRTRPDPVTVCSDHLIPFQTVS